MKRLLAVFSLSFALWGGAAASAEELAATSELPAALREAGVAGSAVVKASNAKTVRGAGYFPDFLAAFGSGFKPSFVVPTDTGSFPSFLTAKTDGGYFPSFLSAGTNGGYLPNFLPSTGAGSLPTFLQPK